MSFVYFMEVGPKDEHALGYIGVKIGFSRFPYTRGQAIIQKLEKIAGQPLRFTIIAMVPGSREQERQMHKLFATFRQPISQYGREWFNVSIADIERFVCYGTVEPLDYGEDDN